MLGINKMCRHRDLLSIWAVNYQLISIATLSSNPRRYFQLRLQIQMPTGAGVVDAFKSIYHLSFITPLFSYIFLYFFFR